LCLLEGAERARTVLVLLYPRDHHLFIPHGGAGAGNHETKRGTGTVGLASTLPRLLRGKQRHPFQDVTLRKGCRRISDGLNNWHTSLCRTPPPASSSCRSSRSRRTRAGAVL